MADQNVPSMPIRHPK